MKRLAQRALSPEGYARLKNRRRRFERALAVWFSANGMTASLYYLFHDAFRREQHATLAGKRQYYADVTKKFDTNAKLRRDVHRIEKGLISQPRRDVFATSYITSTLDVFAAAVRAHDGVIAATGELRWAHDVLHAYFEAVASHPKVDAARDAFHTVMRTASLAPRSEAAAPAPRGEVTPPPVTPEAFTALTKRRRSVRWFLDEPVPRDALDQALLAAGQSPSACNRLPYRFLVYDEPELVQRVATLPFGTKGFEHNFPVIVVLVGSLAAFFSERDRHVPYIDASLAAMSFMLALETHGLSSVPINWPDVEERERRIRHLLGLESHERTIMMMAVGYADPRGGVPASEKRTLDQLRQYNHAPGTQDES